MEKNYRKQIENANQISEAMRLCMEIQNAGIGTAFFQFNAHCNHADIELHCPIWVDRAKPTHRLRLWGMSEQYMCEDAPTSNEEVLAALRKILATGEVIPVDEAIAMMEKEQARIAFETAAAKYNELFNADKAAA